jgi:hypothetical protein
MLAVVELALYFRAVGGNRMENIPNQETGNQNASLATIKLVSNKTHLGPVKGEKQKSSRLSAAANKIRLNNDLKVTLDSVDVSKKSSTKKTSESMFVIDPSKEVRPSVALLLMEAWDSQYGAPGTPDYVRKANALSRAQQEAYAKLGINPNAEVRPELTEEQRCSYNEMVSPFSFDYYEVRLSYKQPGQKSVRSTTYRCLEKPDLRRFKSLLQKQAQVLNTKLKVSAAPRN